MKCSPNALQPLPQVFQVCWRVEVFLYNESLPCLLQLCERLLSSDKKDLQSSQLCYQSHQSWYLHTQNSVLQNIQNHQWPMQSSPTESILISIMVWCIWSLCQKVPLLFFSLCCQQLSSHMHHYGSFSHCWPHWPAVEAHLVARLSPVVFFRAPWSASLPQILCHRFENSASFFCKSESSKSFFHRRKRRKNCCKKCLAEEDYDCQGQISYVLEKDCLTLKLLDW